MTPQSSTRYDWLSRQWKVEKEREIHYVQSASLVYGIVFMSEAFAARQWQTDFWKEAMELGFNLTGTRAILPTMELIAHSLCIANGALVQVAREGWPGEKALLNMGRVWDLSLNCTRAQSLSTPIGSA